MEADDPQPVVDKEPGDLSPEDRLASLEHGFLALRREWREIAIEWESTYNQFRALYARLNRRDQREEKKLEKVESPLNPAALALLNSRRE